jgi:hypothetical protein
LADDLLILRRICVDVHGQLVCIQQGIQLLRGGQNGILSSAPADWTVVTHEEENQDLYVADWEDADAEDFHSKLASELGGKAVMQA